MGRAQTTNVGTRGPEKPSGLGAPTLRFPPPAPAAKQTLPVVDATTTRKKEGKRKKALH